MPHGPARPADACEVDADDPLATLAQVTAPVTALLASDDTEHTREHALERASAARVANDRPPIELRRFGHDGHNLMRYRPREVAAAIASIGPGAVTDPRAHG